MKSKTTWGTPEVHTKVPSSGMGFNSSIAAHGPDTAPGPGPGAPLTSRSVPDGPTKSTHYATGVSPYSLDAGNTTAPEFVKNGKQSLPIDSPVPNTGGRQMPDPDTHGKASAENAAEMKIGSDPKGVLGR